MNTSHTDLYYNPDSYSAPTDFSGNVTGNHTAWMLVNTVGRLQDINTNLAGNYALGRDIDARGFSFVPIGEHPFDYFMGNFDGLNHTIRALSIDGSGSNGVGLFGDIGAGALVVNVGLVDGQVMGKATLRRSGRTQRGHDQKRPFHWRRERRWQCWWFGRLQHRHDHRFFRCRHRERI